jgi:hypothetical protein
LQSTPDPDTPQAENVSFKGYTCTSSLAISPNTYGFTCITDQTFQYYYIEATFNPITKTMTQKKAISMQASDIAQACNTTIRLDARFIAIACLPKNHGHLSVFIIITINREKGTMDQDSFYYNEANTFLGRINLSILGDWLLVYDEVDPRLQKTAHSPDGNRILAAAGGQRKAVVYRFPIDREKDDDYFVKVSYRCKDDTQACLSLDFSGLYADEKGLDSEDLFIRSLSSVESSL